MHEDLNDSQRLAWERAQWGKAVQGESAAFAELYKAYAQLLYARVLLPKLGQAAAAEDALAETFRTAFEKLAQYEPRQTSIYFWFARIAEHKVLDMHRARAVTGRAIVNLQAHFAELGTAQAGADAQMSLIEQERRARVRLEACFAALNPRYARALQLRFYQEGDRESCAQALGVTVPTFDVLLLRALRALRKEWEAQVSNAKEPVSER